ncbi:MAG: VOC family protein [Hyphomicrobiaceae bacterium]
MFDDIQHIGYLVDDLDAAVAWFAKAFGAANAGGTKMQDSPMVPGGGRNAFVRFGAVEVELMEPSDTSKLPKSTLVMHHVGYVTDDIVGAASAAKSRGLKFLADAPYTNPMGQQVHYFDPASTNGVWMHLTKVPDRDRATVGAGGPLITGIVHPGYLVRDLDRAVAWHLEKLGGTHVGGGPSRRGGRVAFINWWWRSDRADRAARAVAAGWRAGARSCRLSDDGAGQRPCRASCARPGVRHGGSLRSTRSASASSISRPPAPWAPACT